MTLPGCSRLRSTSASMPMPIRSSERSMSSAWALVRLMMNLFSPRRRHNANFTKQALREIQVLLALDNSRLSRELVEKAQPLAVLLVQSIVNVFGEVNLHLVRLEAVLRRVLSGNLVDRGQAVVSGSFEILAEPPNISL